MLHILLIAEDTSGQLNKNFYYMEQALSRRVQLSIWRKPGHIRHIIKQLSGRPDFILLLNDLGQRLYPTIKGLAYIDIPTGLFVNDVHRLTKHRRHMIEQNHISYLFTAVRDTFLTTYPEFGTKMQWLPHFVNTDIYDDYGLTKDINLLMMGAVNDIYPLRQTILKTYQDDSRFIYHKHPGYRSFSRHEERQLLIGPAYARELNRASIFFTSPSIFKYPVRKYLEALACRTLLLAPTFKELEDLGFIPYHHFVPINEHNFQAQAAYYLAHETERQNITDQGYRFIRNTHTVERRTEQLITRIQAIVHS